jgi:NAD(P)-dependent dehydrogenase (short-subunit alcohol dehydrogenase family)
MRLQDKAIVITGATGIAASSAAHAVAEGARVFVISIDESECRSLASQVDLAGYAVADLTVESAANDGFVSAIETLGGMEGLLAVAGGSGRRFGDGPLHELGLGAWEKTLALNTTPVFLAARAAIGAMREGGGSIVLISSVLATRPVPELFATHAYSAAKGAVNALVTTLASFYATDRIRVNGIAPGLVRTPMSERAARDPATVEYALRKQPVAGGFLAPDAVADAAVFLLSAESAQVTGQVLAVDGGWSVTEA